MQVRVTVPALFISIDRQTSDLIVLRSLSASSCDDECKHRSHLTVSDTGREDFSSCWEGLLGDCSSTGEGSTCHQGIRLPMCTLRIESADTIQTSDGPNGARGEQFSGGTRAACFPAAVCSAASWNPEYAHKIGNALAEETKTKSARVL